VNLYSIIPSALAGIISLSVLFYPQEKRQKYKNRRFQKKWITEYLKENPKKTKLEAEVAFLHKQSQKQEAHLSPIIMTDNRLNALAILLAMFAVFL
jgi:hypothetical protein